MKNGALKSSEFDVLPKHKRIIVFKLGKIWAFKHFFDDRKVYDELMNYYNKDLYRFEFKSHAVRNNGLKILERNGFDYELVENLKVTWS
ncbi:MAG: hypothetical protein LUQ47_00825, partial [Methanotrichaceae archaeon]|nr:hypothetical protein [Methanotrichaceae archaeon]